MGIGKIVKHLVGSVAPKTLLLRGKGVNGQVVALTFDDGPHLKHSPMILDVLAEHEIQASFFVVGEEAQKYPHLIRRMMDDGHEVANHSYSHYGVINKAPADYVEDVERCQQVLQDICGQELTKNFRPPYGTIHPAVFIKLIRNGYRFILWSADSNDSRVRSSEDLIASFATLPLISGDIILLHEDYLHTLQALPDLIRIMQGNSFRFVTSGEW